MSKYVEGDTVGCSICVPLFQALKPEEQAVVLSVSEPTDLDKRMGYGPRYMVRYPSGFIDWLNEEVTRTPGVYPGVAPYKHQGHAIKRQ